MSTRERKHVSMMFDLCKTISEGAAYLMQSTDSLQLKNDTIEAVTALEESLRSLNAPDIAIHAAEDFRHSIEAESYTNKDEFHTQFHIWYYTTLRTLRILWKAGTFECPLCGGIGAPFYSAAYYISSRDRVNISPARQWMQCTCCRNYYVAADNIKHGKPKESSQLRADRYERILTHIKDAPANGRILIICEDARPFALAARFHALEVYHCRADKLKKLCSGCQAENRFQFIILEQLCLVPDIQDTLEQAIGCLSDDGRLWFDMPNLDGAIYQYNVLSKSLKDVWAVDALLTSDGVVNLAETFGMDVLKIAAVEVGETLEMVVRRRKEKGEG